MSEKLLPCPFCGGDPALQQEAMGLGKAKYRVACKACECRQPLWDLPESASKEWNTRVGVAPKAKQPACKTIYVKPLRTLVAVDERFADCIRDLLNDAPPARSAARSEVLAALKPLAGLYDQIDDRDADPDTDIFFQHDGTKITFGDIRRARALLSRNERATPPEVK